MSQWQPEDRSARPPATPPEFGNRAHVHPHGQQQYPQEYAQRFPQDFPRQSQRHGPRKTGLTVAEGIWYFLGCLWFGAWYFLKIPSKKALQDYGMAELTAMESFWYLLMCLWFGMGYFAKIPTAKAISEMTQFRG